MCGADGRLTAARETAEIWSAGNRPPSHNNLPHVNCDWHVIGRTKQIHFDTIMSQKICNDGDSYKENTSTLDQIMFRHEVCDVYASLLARSVSSGTDNSKLCVGKSERIPGGINTVTEKSIKNSFGSLCNPTHTIQPPHNDGLSQTLLHLNPLKECRVRYTGPLIYQEGHVCTCTPTEGHGSSDLWPLMSTEVWFESKSYHRTPEYHS